MANQRFYGIKFPFQTSTDGFFFDLTKTTKDSVRSNLIHLLLTNKGNRLYKPNFGCNITQYLFDPVDEQTSENIKAEIIDTVQTNMQGIDINSVNVIKEEKTITLQVNYSFNDGVFSYKDIIELNF
jgi:phage baseplate assembly protein W